MPPTPDDILAGLDPEQREVASRVSGPMVVLAGAGTGKTRAITSRIAYGVAAGVHPASALLAVTFTARAAGEMRSRLRALGAGGVQARTFHSAALRQLQYFWPRSVGGQLPSLAAHKAPLVAEAASRLRLPTDRAAIRDLAAEIEWAKVSQVRAEDYASVTARAGRIPPAGLDATQASRLLGTYDDVKRARGLIDFEDVLVLMVGLLAEDAGVAAAVRAQYSRFVVDEYQDVNPLQQNLLELWLGGRDELCVVGDPSQTIYSFTGASPEHLLGFRRRFPHAHEVRLVRDYRSTPQVVGAANAVLARAAGPREQRLQLVAQRPDGPGVRFLEHADEAAEADAVAREAARLIGAGVRPSEIAVLFRTNSQSEAYEAALSDAKVSYQLRGGERFFERREVREAHLLLRGAARSGSGDDPAGEGARAVLSSMGYGAEPPSGSGAVRERWESLHAIVGLADDLTATRVGSSLTDLVAELDERAGAQHAPTVEGVTLASLHSAKGLEWDAVFLVGVVEGLLPISFADTPDAVEEERRLLYVGVTRAREHLVVSWSRARGRKPSRFLDGLRPDDGRGSAPASPRSRNARGRAALPTTCPVCSRPLSTVAERKVGRCDDCPPAYDEAVFERLRAWRASLAKEQSVPAFVIFTDATLAKLAEEKPEDERSMARIPGVGATKLERYAGDVLTIVRGESPATITP